MNEWIRIKIDNEKFNLDSVNCVEIGISYCLGIYGGEFQKYFLLLLKMIQSYNVTGFNDTSIVNPVNIHPYIQSILNNWLHIQINFHELSEDSFYELIEGVIMKGRPVLVTGNLRELYYSPNYMNNDSRHVILINGFDKEKKIFKIIDGEHFYVRNKCRYNQFSIPYQTVKEMLLSYRNVFGEFFICDLQSGERIFNKVSVLNDCLSLYGNINSDFNKYKEINYLDTVSKAISEGDNKHGNIDVTLLRIIRYKEMFYTLLASAISEIWGDDDMVGGIIQLKDHMIPVWRDICNTCILGLYKKSVFNIDTRLQEAMKYELQMKNTIKGLIR